ncbi:hypothetical protein CERSUDRAFT_123399 [Gelatoporia subvermispora B]|uniref:NACHT domain-containing protein n=1 Tax=Ceriporiopsis subvermispora (strain B) TaxID=914234 RepID=M2RG72_CERS8|nr:hypothetical protein CERSUDRAFT_123399 [Gelatoporia subvermispora B]
MSPIQSNLRRLRDRLSPLPEHGDGQLSASSTPQRCPTQEGTLTSGPSYQLTINPVYTPLTSAQKPPWSAQQTMNSNDTKSDPDPSEFASLFRDALDEFSKRTEIDLATNPLTRQFMTCDSIDKVMVILENQVQKFNEFRHGGIKMQLIRKLHPLVTVILTLSRSEILLEGLEAAFGPSVAVVAALGVLLEAAKGVSASYDALSELLDCITSFLVRLEVFTRMQLSPAMRAILVKTLVHVISVLSLAIEQVKQGRLVAYFKRLLGNKDVEKALHELERLTVEQAQMTGVESLELIYNLVNSLSVTMKNGQVPTGPIRESLDRLGACLSGMRQDIDELKLPNADDNILQQHRDWLSPPDPSRYYNVAIKLYHKSTGRWLIESEPMQRWKRMGSLLWIHGKPGSGKTVMCSAIIEDLARLCIVQLKSVLIYFYCDYADSTTQSVRGLLSHLVLCIPTRTRSDVCTEILSHLYSKNDNGGQQPSDDELEECLQEMLEQTADYSVYIVIDAVDECPSSGIPSMRTRMLELITRITGWQIKNVRICLTSRPEPDVRDVLDRLSPLTITLHEGSGQAQDIATYVRSVMESDPGFRLWNGEDKALAMQELSEKANGMFRWVYCQLDMLRGCQRANIRQVLRNLPRTLDETYQRMLKDLDTENWKYTHRLFQCLVVYSRPLRINELAEVVAIDFKSLAAPGVKADWRRKQ